MQVERAGAAIFAMVLGLGAAHAQSVREIPSPSEAPPASFVGPQYVDSQGCVFVRGGLDGAVIWVPRMSSQRKLLCGYPPSLAAITLPENDPLVAPAPETTTTRKAVKAARDDDPKVEPAGLRTGDNGKSPVTKPVVAAPVAIILSQPVAHAQLRHPVVPKGYKLAWKDGRLNPDRAQGTAFGQAQQDMIWSRDTPMQLLTAARTTKEAKAQPRNLTVVRYVQVGSFGDRTNARAASKRIAALGLPVAMGEVSHSGQRLQVVLAGPFDTKADTNAALKLARSGGFPDAIIR